MKNPERTEELVVGERVSLKSESAKVWEARTVMVVTAVIAPRSGVAGGPVVLNQAVNVAWVADGKAHTLQLVDAACFDSLDEYELELARLKELQQATVVGIARGENDMLKPCVQFHVESANGYPSFKGTIDLPMGPMPAETLGVHRLTPTRGHWVAQAMRRVCDVLDAEVIRAESPALRSQRGKDDKPEGSS